MPFAKWDKGPPAPCDRPYGAAAPAWSDEQVGRTEEAIMRSLNHLISSVRRAPRAPKA